MSNRQSGLPPRRKPTESSRAASIYVEKVLPTLNRNFAGGILGSGYLH